MLSVILSGIIVYLLYLYCSKGFNYWEKRGVPYKNPWKCLISTVKGLLGRLGILENAYNDYNYKPESKILGLYAFRIPLLVVRDPECIKQICIKAFDNFTDRTPFASDDDHVFNKTLFLLQGQKWRDMRPTLSPAFTSSKMKMMFDLISQCGEHMANHYIKVADEQDGKPICIEMKDTFTHFTNDVIATAAFGINVDSFSESDHEFYKHGKIITQFNGVIFILLMAFPRIVKWLGSSLFPKTSIEYFRNLVLQNIKEREEKYILRPDVIHLLVQAKKGELRHDKLVLEETGFATVTEDMIGIAEKKQKHDITNDDIVAQALGFFIAGFDTSSTLLTFMAYELAINPDIQEILQKEIDTTLDECQGKITYQSLFQMKYMDMVVSEALRKWPPSPVFDRLCVNDFTLETPESNVEISKGTTLIFPMYGFHHDPKYFPNPESFLPDRFSDENKRNIQPYTYFPFGVGPRSCIGSRFALMESKIAIFHILAKFDLVVIDKTEIPVQIYNDPVRYGAKNGVWLGLKKRK